MIYITAVELVDRIKSILSDEDKWIKNNFAADPDGCPTRPCSQNATSWCLEGAKERVLFDCRMSDAEYNLFVEKEMTVLSRQHDIAVSDFNDDPSTTFNDIHKFLDEIKKLIQERTSEPRT